MVVTTIWQEAYRMPCIDSKISLYNTLPCTRHNILCIHTHSHTHNHTITQLHNHTLTRTATQAHFHARARDGLSLCFSLCESLVDALTEAQGDATQDGPSSDEEESYQNPQHAASLASHSPQHAAGLVSSSDERAMIQVLGNVDDVAGLLLQFVEQQQQEQQEGGTDVDGNVVLACVRVLGRCVCVVLWLCPPNFVHHVHDTKPCQCHNACVGHNNNNI